MVENYVETFLPSGKLGIVLTASKVAIRVLLTETSDKGDFSM